MCFSDWLRFRQAWSLVLLSVRVNVSGVQFDRVLSVFLGNFEVSRSITVEPLGVSASPSPAHIFSSSYDPLFLPSFFPPHCLLPSFPSRLLAPLTCFISLLLDPSHPVPPPPPCLPALPAPPFLPTLPAPPYLPTLPAPPCLPTLPAPPCLPTLATLPQAPVPSIVSTLIVPSA
ncbi:unnamed protein product [Closterium sp. Naga37s-1]|nr:unnamed protein product [Closterium sp. Naga37s-1]